MHSFRGFSAFIVLLLVSFAASRIVNHHYGGHHSFGNRKHFVLPIASIPYVSNRGQSVPRHHTKKQHNFNSVKTAPKNNKGHHGNKAAAEHDHHHTLRHHNINYRQNVHNRFHDNIMSHHDENRPQQLNSHIHHHVDSNNKKPVEQQPPVPAVNSAKTNEQLISAEATGTKQSANSNTINQQSGHSLPEAHRSNADDHSNRMRFQKNNHENREKQQIRRAHIQPNQNQEDLPNHQERRREFERIQTITRTNPDIPPEERPGTDDRHPPEHHTIQFADFEGDVANLGSEETGPRIEISHPTGRDHPHLRIQSSEQHFPQHQQEQDENKQNSTKTSKTIVINEKLPNDRRSIRNLIQLTIKVN